MTGADAADWLTEGAHGLRLRVKVTPRAARSAVQGVERDAAGGRQLAVRIAAPPDAGKANAALLKLLARRWDLPARDVRLVSGATARRKVLEIAGAGAALAARLRALEEMTADGGGGT